MAAFSLLGKRAFSGTQSPGTIIRCFSCLSCSHRDNFTFVSDWFFFFFDYLASFAVYFCILSVGGEKLFGPKPRGIGKNGECCSPSENRHLSVVYVQTGISTYTVHILI